MAMESLRPVFAKWGELRIDLFATFANRRLVKFVSPYPDPRAEWTDAMSMPWDYGRDLLVRVPVIQDGPASTAEDSSVTRSGGDFDRSTATGSIMVPRVDGPIPRRSDSTVRRRSRPTDMSRIFTTSVFGRETGCQKSSFQHLHDAPLRGGLLPSTLISHRTSVASMLRHWVYDPAADPYIKLLVRAFGLERPVQRRIMPKWDLYLVLLLLRPPFISQVEVHGKSSDDVIPLKWRTLNVCSCWHWLRQDGAHTCSH